MLILGSLLIRAFLSSIRLSSSLSSSQAIMLMVMSKVVSVLFFVNLCIVAGETLLIDKETA